MHFKDKSVWKIKIVFVGRGRVSCKYTIPEYQSVTQHLALENKILNILQIMKIRFTPEKYPSSNFSINEKIIMAPLLTNALAIIE